MLISVSIVCVGTITGDMANTAWIVATITVGGVSISTGGSIVVQPGRAGLVAQVSTVGSI